MNQPAGPEPHSWGQLLMVGIPGPRLDAVARELVRDLKVGGIILFARNLESPEQVWRLTRDLRQESPGGRPPAPAHRHRPGRGPGAAPKAPFTLIPAEPGSWGLPPPRKRWRICPGGWAGNWHWWESMSTWPRSWTSLARPPAPSGSGL